MNLLKVEGWLVVQVAENYLKVQEQVVQVGLASVYWEAVVAAVVRLNGEKVVVEVEGEHPSAWMAVVVVAVELCEQVG